MKINKLYKPIIFIFFTLFSFSCLNFSQIKTDDYTIKIPESNSLIKVFKLDTTNIDITNQKNNFSVCVIKRNKHEYYSINECVSMELAHFIQEKNTYNIITKHSEIQGSEAIIISGKNIKKNNNYYWTFAIFSNKYYYFIVRVYSNQTNCSFNEYYNSKIIQSFHLN